MQNYLSGYLSVLPLVQRKRIVDLLSRNEDYKFSVVSSTEFNKLMEQITDERAQATEYIPQVNELDSDIYNQFFGRVYTDLNFMFNDVNLVDRAILNHRSLAFSELSNLNKEVNDLYTQIENLRQSSAGEDGLIVKTESFQGAIFEEDPEGVYADLFCDRDGSPLPRSSTALNSRKRALSLKPKTVIDRVHNTNGLLDADIQVLDQRGQSLDIAGRGIDKILDGSDETYWVQIVHADDEIDMQMYGVPGPGAMSKMVITFNSPTMMSEISISPFTVYPVEVSAILYEQEIAYDGNSDTISPAQRYLMASSEVMGLNPEITTLIDVPHSSSSDTMVFSFPSTLVKRLIIVLKQSNYMVKNGISTNWDIEKENLWSALSTGHLTDKQRFEIYLESANGGYKPYV